MRNKLSDALWGVFFIVIGLAIAAKSIWDFDIFFKGWWTLFIIVPCFISMIKSKFGIGSTIGFVIGVYLLLAAQPGFGFGFGFSLRKLLLPIIFVFVGLRIILKNIGWNPPRLEYKPEEDNNVYNEDGNNEYGNHVYNEDGSNIYDEDRANNNQEIIRSESSLIGLPEYNATFNSNTINIQERFYGASLNSIFGSLVIDLRSAIIEQDIEINATSIFAGIDIYMPEGINIKTNSVPIFGGISNKVDKPGNAGAPTIYLKATCMFGGIDIK